MNEGDGSILSKVTRKKRRGSGFRFSSKKDLERSKLMRAAKSRGSELASVTKALTYPLAQSSNGVHGSGGPVCLEVVKEKDGDENDQTKDNAIIDTECILQVSTFIDLVKFSPLSSEY
jgi:DNA-binding transcriptional MerR regulator